MSTERNLSEEEVAGIAEALKTTMESNGAEPLREVQTYDLAHPAKLGSGHLKVVENLLRSVERPWTTGLGSLLGRQIVVSLDGVEQTRFSGFVASLISPVLIASLDMGTLGKAFLCIPGGLARELVNRACGAPAHSVSENSGFTRIERAIARRLLGRLVTAINHAWSAVAHIEAAVTDCVDSADDVRLGGDDSVIVVGYAAEAEDKRFRIDLAMSGDALNAVRDSLTMENILRASLGGTAKPDSQSGAIIESVSLEIAVELGSANVSVSDLAGLSVGDIIRLEQRVGDSILLRVQGEPMFYAYPGLWGPKMAVQIMNVCSEGAVSEQK